MTPTLRMLAFAALPLLVLGCNDSKSSRSDGTTAAPIASGATTGVTGTGSPGTSTNAAPPTAATPAPATPPTGTTGSRFWYENDAFGNAFKQHTANEAALAQQILNLVNAERAAAGLQPVQYDQEAELAAKVHSEDMEGRNFFDHITPEGWSPADRLTMTGASGFVASGENVAFGQPTPADVMAAWMASPGHRANILYPSFTHLGVGVAEGRPYWTQVFLTR